MYQIQPGLALGTEMSLDSEGWSYTAGLAEKGILSEKIIQKLGRPLEGDCGGGMLKCKP